VELIYCFEHLKFYNLFLSYLENEGFASSFMIVKSSETMLRKLCYTDSFHTIKLIQEGDQMSQRFGYEIALIKNMLPVCALREGNHCVAFLAKMGAKSNVPLVIVDSPPTEIWMVYCLLMPWAQVCEALSPSFSLSCFYLFSFVIKNLGLNLNLMSFILYQWFNV
jgi:hypothetical protein